jgi:hypothetical protein
MISHLMKNVPFVWNLMLANCFTVYSVNHSELNYVASDGVW